MWDPDTDQDVRTWQQLVANKLKAIRYDKAHKVSDGICPDRKWPWPQPNRERRIAMAIRRVRRPTESPLLAAFINEEETRTSRTSRTHAMRDSDSIWVRV